MTVPPRLSLVGISKSFGGIQAVQDVAFDVAPATIHALVGENGAGKSTLVKIITGLQPADAGEIRLDGVPVRFRTPMEARAAGVVAVYQDPKLFPHLDVAENIFMGIHPLSRLGVVDRRQMYQRARELLATLDVELDPTALVAGLSLGEVQFVEFARAMAEGAERLLILDEPTAALTPDETARLFRVVRRLRDRGAAVIFISHRLEELAGLVGFVTVLRDGRHIATAPAATLDRTGVVRLMVGRSLDQLYPHDPESASRRGREFGAERLRVEGLGQEGVFDDISFGLRAGEIVGLAGLVGAGRSEIAQTIFGATPPTAGRVFIDGRAVAVRNPRQMLGLGVAYLPEDRDGEGLITGLSIVKNLVLPIIDRLAWHGVLRPGRERAETRAFADRLQIKAASLEQAVSALSGGNRQKVVLGKWLAMGPRVLILDEPTHGIDVGTKAQVHQIIDRLAADGIAILMISSDLPEVLRMSDRILVVADGRLTGAFGRDEATQEVVMTAATQRRRSRPAA
jgi:rhamnose transport system ATP-binding protein